MQNLSGIHTRSTVLDRGADTATCNVSKYKYIAVTFPRPAGQEGRKKSHNVSSKDLLYLNPHSYKLNGDEK